MIETRFNRALALTLAASACFALPAAAQVAPDKAIIPQPQKIEARQGVFQIDASTVVLTPAGDAEAAQAAARFVELLKQTNGLQLTVREGERGHNAIVFKREAGQPEDGYRLTVDGHGAVVTGSDSGGLLYGGVSLWQLASADGSGKVQAVEITDAPRFGWRGLMLDSARHYQSVEFIKSFIDWLAAHKMNTFHWHLVDDQAWRLEIKKYPRLTEVGAWRVLAGQAAQTDIDSATGQPRLYGGFYSQDQIRDIVAYAQARNVTIVPEVEVPGHASAAIAAYPELAVSDAPGSEMPAVPSDWGVYPNLFNTEESTIAFFRDVLDEVMALFPSEYIHVGGDEAVKDQWKASPRTQERMREVGAATENEMQSWFITQMEQHLNANGRRLIGWDEILEGGLAPNATVMSWRGVAGAIESARLGHDTVMSPAPILYLDHRQSAREDQPGRGEPMTLQAVYQFDPTPPELTQDQVDHVLGVQGNLWTEHMRDEARVEYQAFPRAAAIAEIGWSEHDRMSWEGFQTRLEPQLKRYDALGIGYARTALTPDAAPMKADGEPRYDHELKLCGGALVLTLIDDAPIEGERPSLMMDIMNPCWIYEQADLTDGPSIDLMVGQVPWNFQIGAAKDGIKLATPRTPEGELQIHIGSCDAEPAVVIPLGEAAANLELSPLSGQLPAMAGRHDLCFRFSQHGLDPMWGIEWVKVGAVRD